MMMNLERKIRKDLRPESTESLIEVEKRDKELLERAKNELQMLKPTLHDVMRKIEEKKPDVVVFLDKGARIFAGPMMRALHARKINHTPEFSFYNDDTSKHKYCKHEWEELKELLKKDFSELKDKKVLFVDETYSSGKGASVIFHLKKKLNMDLEYVSLSTDTASRESDHWDDIHELDSGIHDIVQKAIKKDTDFTISDNQIKGALFSKDAAELYVVDDHNYNQNKTKFRYQKVDDVDKAYNYEGTLHVREGTDLPEGSASWQEHDIKVRRIHMQTLKEIRKEIYKTLVEKIEN